LNARSDQNIFSVTGIRPVSSIPKSAMPGVRVVIWFEAEILSQQPGFDCRADKPKIKDPIRPPAVFLSLARLARRSVKRFIIPFHLSFWLFMPQWLRVIAPG